MKISKQELEKNVRIVVLSSSTWNDMESIYEIVQKRKTNPERQRQNRLMKCKSMALESFSFT